MTVVYVVVMVVCGCDCIFVMMVCGCDDGVWL